MRRIIPALYLVIAVTAVLGLLWLTPDDMKNMARSIVAMAFFVSNVFFWRDSGYFQAESSLKPLLHTWSLSVEEQFYLLYPVFLAVLWRRRRSSLAPTLVFLLMVSLLTAEWGARHKPSATYLLLPTRAWELVLGAMLALWHRNREPLGPQRTDRRAIGEAAALGGVALILLAALTFNQRTIFPGLTALVPTIGAALVIHYGHGNTLTGRILAMRPLVGIGLVSYSAYLWQQPLFAFARQHSLWEPPTWVMISLVVATFALAYATWRLVEKPARAPGNLTRRQLITGTVAATCCLAGFGLAGELTAGEYFRRGATVAEHGIDRRLSSNQGLGTECDGAFSRLPSCRTSDDPDVVLWGDSHAMHLVQGLIASKPDIRMIQFTRSVCAPVLGMAPVSGKTPAEWARDCIATNDSVLNWIRGHKSIRYAVLGSPLAAYVSEDARVLLRDGSIVAARPLIEAYLRRTIVELEGLGIHTVFFASPPANGANVGRCLKNAVRFGRPYSLCNFTRAEAESTQSAAVSVLRGIATNHPVVWLYDELCPGQMCMAAVGDTLIYRDNGHLTAEGSALLGRRMNFFELLSGAASR